MWNVRLVEKHLNDKMLYVFFTFLKFSQIGMICLTEEIHKETWPRGKTTHDARQQGKCLTQIDRYECPDLSKIREIHLKTWLINQPSVLQVASKT